MRFYYVASQKANFAVKRVNGRHTQYTLEALLQVSDLWE